MGVQSASNPKGLLAVLGGAILSAFAIAAFSLYQFGPSGQYRIQNALIQPMLLQNMSFDQINTKTGGESRFVFDELSYSFYDAVAKQIRSVPVTISKYQSFYDLISGENSLADVPSSVESLFDRANPSVLRLKIRTEATSRLQKESQVFQEIQFANEGNFYRVELREELSPQGKWAYYHHPKIAEEAQTIFTTHD